MGLRLIHDTEGQYHSNTLYIDPLQFGQNFTQINDLFHTLQNQVP